MADRRPRRGCDAVPPPSQGPDDQVRLLEIASRVARLGGWVVDLSDGIVRLTDEACAIQGVPPGTSYPVEQGLDMCTEASRPALAAAFEACTRAGTPFDLELTLITRSGSVVPVRTIGEAVRGSAGRIVRVQGAIQDISGIRNLARALESVTDAFYTLDREWRFTYLNNEAERVQQRSRAELLGRVVWDAFPESVGSAFDTEFHRAIETGQPVAFESSYPPLDLLVAVRAFPSADGLAVYFRDVKEERAAADALRASEHRYRTLFERAGDAIVIADDSGHFVDANDAARTLLGLPGDAILGQTLQDSVVGVLDGIQIADAWGALRAVGEMRGEIQLRRADGEIRDVEFSAVADISAGLHLGVLRDITERRRHERAVDQRNQIIRALRHLSPRDDAEETADAICAEIVSNGDFPSAAIYAFGSDDDALAIGAGFRDGRDRDALPLLSDTRLANLRSRAADGPWIETWQGAGDEPARRAMSLVGVSAAIIAPIESDGRLIAVLAAGSLESRERLVERVPALMEYAALSAALLGPGLRLRIARAAERRRIRRIISLGAFRPVFQPIVDMSSGEVLGYEALTRFADGTSPDAVFAAAVEVGLGLELEAATIEVALAASAPLPAGGFLDMNVSPELILAGEPLAGLLRRSRLGVVLEITEHANVRDYDALRRAITALGSDVRFAVDDAGAGFASLRHILELEPSHVKLDRALVTGIDHDPARQALATGLVHFAQKIDAILIAEGVETAAERDTLLSLGIRAGQGFLFGRAVRVEEIASPGSGASRP